MIASNFHSIASRIKRDSKRLRNNELYLHLFLEIILNPPIHKFSWILDKRESFKWIIITHFTSYIYYIASARLIRLINDVRIWFYFIWFDFRVWEIEILRERPKKIPMMMIEMIFSGVHILFGFGIIKYKFEWTEEWWFIKLSIFSSLSRRPKVFFGIYLFWTNLDWIKRNEERSVIIDHSREEQEHGSRGILYRVERRQKV